MGTNERTGGKVSAIPRCFLKPGGLAECSEGASAHGGLSTCSPRVEIEIDGVFSQKQESRNAESPSLLPRAIGLTRKGHQNLTPVQRRSFPWNLVVRFTLVREPDFQLNYRS